MANFDNSKFYCKIYYSHPHVTSPPHLNSEFRNISVYTQYTVTPTMHANSNSCNTIGKIQNNMITNHGYESYDNFWKLIRFQWFNKTVIDYTYFLFKT